MKKRIRIKFKGDSVSYYAVKGDVAYMLIGFISFEGDQYCFV